MKAWRENDTAGPWRIDGETIRGANGWEICNTFQNDSPMGLIEAGANAEKIVSCVNACEGLNPEAVPELLKALEALASAFDKNALNMQEVAILEKADEAIKKAKGESE